MTTQISSDNIQQSTLESLGGGPTITNVQITDSSYNVLDDTAVGTSGGYLKITGTNFASGCTVIVGSTNATSTTFVDSTTLNVQVPAATAGTYIVYVVNTDGGVAIRVNGLTYSGTPTWVTGSTLPSGTVDTAISIQLSATADSTVSYSVQVGSTLPTGLTLTSGGLLSGTITGLTSETTYNFVIEAIDTELQDSPRTFSITITAGDLYWSNVTTLLSPTLPSVLPFNDDASTNNFAVTINGDTKPNSFSPYTPGYYSNYFDGTGDYLTVPDNTAFDLGNSDFTFEVWVYPTSAYTISTEQFLFDQWASGNYGYEFSLITNGTSFTGIRFAYSQTGAVGNITTRNFTQVIPLNAWSHVAFVRNAGTVTAYYNGTSIGTSSDNVTIFNSTQTPHIGASPDGGINQLFYGYLSNMRLVKGTAVYTTTFTPPTAPLTAVSGTSLLTCQSNRFIDNSTNNFTITRNGDTRISSFDPFVPNSSYSTRGSTYFDGTGDYLDIPSNAAFGYGTGDFTIEFWAYFLAGANTTTPNVLDQRSGANVQAVPTIYLNSGTLTYYSNGGNRITGPAIAVNQWYHIVLCRSSGVTAFYVNGVQSGTWSDSTNYISSPVRVFASNDSGSLQATPGYCSNLRIVKGTALYTSAFTPPAEPLTAVSGTSLLTCQTNQPVNNNVFLDNSTNNFLITRANNTTQGTFSPYGENWSIYSTNASGNGLTVATNTALNLGTGNFTIECWVMTMALPTTNAFQTSAGGYQSIFGSGPNVSGTGSTFYIGTTNIYFDIATDGGGPISASHGFSVNTWYHLAIVRSGNTFTLYKNGVSIATGTSSSSWVDGYGLGIASPEPIASGGYTGAWWYGYISNFRIIKGTALYTGNFTPSTTPLQPVAGTSLLTCKDPNIVDDSANNFTVTVSGSVSVQKFGPFAGTTLPTPYYSAYFDGSGDYLSIPSNSSLTFGTGDFTIEGWYYLTAAASSTKYLFDCRSGAGNQAAPLLLIQDGAYQYYVNGAYVALGGVPVQNSWVHFALVKTAGSTKLYINGTVVFTYTDAVNYTSSTIRIASEWSASGLYDWQGYISNFRVVKGTAVYTSTFTPPTAPLTAIANTSLLTCQSNTFVDNSTNNFNITANGNTKPSTFAPFAVSYSTKQSYTPSVFGGSMYFDGTGDYLNAGTNSAYSLGSSNFTMECWAYINARGISGTCFAGTWAASGRGWIFVCGPTLFSFVYSTDGSNFTALDATYTVPLNQWTHLAAVRSGNTLTVYANGVARGTASVTGVTIATPTQPLYIGQNKQDVDSSVNNYAMNGYISDFRIVKGTAVYTSNFVPQNSPLASISNTTFLTTGISAGILNSSGQSVFETVGDAKLSTSTIKYSNTSIYFDGSGDGLLAPTSPNLSMGAGDFTIEFWYNPTSTAGTNPNIMCNNNGSGSFVSGMWSLHAPHSSYANKYSLWVASYSTSSALLVSSSNISTGTWTYITITRSGNTWRMFINGTIEATGTNSGILDSGSNPLYVGFQPNAESGRYITGYMSDLRITKGIARYTANFTPPTSSNQTK